jgi:hypothetical protein
MDEMAQEETTTEGGETSSSPTASVDGGVVENNVSNDEMLTMSPSKRPVVLGTAERNSKTGLSLTLTPSTGVEVGTAVVGPEQSTSTSNNNSGQGENTGTQQQQPSSTSTVASDHVFVDPRTLAKKGPVLSQKEEEVSEG